MKKLSASLMSLSLLCLLGAGALADHKDLKEHVTISEKVWVNNTLIKPGDYLIKYDASSGEMKIMSGNKVVAQAKATVKLNNEKFDQDALLTTTTSNGVKLMGVRLGGQHEELDLTDVSADVNQDDDFTLDMGW